VLGLRPDAETAGDEVEDIALVYGVDHGHGVVPVHERGHDGGRDNVHACGNVHVTGFDRSF
jgi:hypothetical protein